MESLDTYNVSELKQEELIHTEGGIAFVLGCIIGCCIGALLVSASYHIAKAIEE